MTNYREKFLKLAIEAINSFIRASRTKIECKDIRKINQIPSTDRSSTNFIWRSLHHLERQGYLALDGRSTPRLYEIIETSPIEVKNVLNKKDKSKTKP